MPRGHARRPWRRVGRQPSTSMVSKGFLERIPPSRYRARKAPSASSRERPQVVWVRSLVPKEKKSASPAILSATAQARGSSIMVPILTGFSAPRTSSTTPSISPRIAASSGRKPTRGTMISTWGSWPSSLTAFRGLGDGAGLHPVESRTHDPKPAAPQSQHRVRLLQALHNRS